MTWFQLSLITLVVFLLAMAFVIVGIILGQDDQS